MTPKQAKLVMKIGSCAPVYVFTFQASLSGDSGSRTNGGDGLTSPSDETAQNIDDAPSPQLTLAQVEAARNAAAAVLELVGATVVSTSSVLQIDAPTEDARLVLTPTVETLAVLADAQTRTEALEKENEPLEEYPEQVEVEPSEE